MKKSPSILNGLVIFFLFVAVPILLGFYLLHLWAWDFSIPLAYGVPGADEVWQLIATKTLLDTGWILENPFLGAPDISTWYANSASQISVFHQAFMYLISLFQSDAIKVQQYYFLINFSLITTTTFLLTKTLKIDKVYGYLIGLIYATTYYRIGSLFFAYLANYWIIPLTLIPIYWIFLGEFDFNGRSPLSKDYIRKLTYGMLISCVVALTDGYYAFFYLLLLALAFLNQCIALRPFNIRSLGAVSGFITATMVVSLLITAPLTQHRKDFPHEANQDQMKSSWDAEVYSPTFKLLVLPINGHRIEAVDRFSKSILETANFNRKFPYPTGAPVVLGFTGTLLLILAISYLLTRNNKNYSTSRGFSWFDNIADHSAKMALFILLCSVTGGIGSLIAILYPSIRAYERFPIFLILVLLIGAGALYTSFLINEKKTRKNFYTFGILLLAILAILDQTKSDTLGLKNGTAISVHTKRFLAERDFVHLIEDSFPAGANKEVMIYQYPYSQYLTNNRYYGWGQFGHMRLYLHSRKIRWSNGAAKGSYVDRWHERKSALPINRLITEMASVGFKGVVVDRLVVKDDEYQAIKRELVKITGHLPLENNDAKLAFWMLPEPKVFIKYDANYQQLKYLKVNDHRINYKEEIPQMVNSKVLESLLSNDSQKEGDPELFSFSAYPHLFVSSQIADRGLGGEILKNEEMKGGVRCDPSLKQGLNMRQHTPVQLTIINDSDFNWRFDTGEKPLKVGVMLRKKDNTFVKDFRVDMHHYFLESHTSHTMEVRLDDLLNINDLNQNEYLISIRLLQDGNRWFDGEQVLECAFSLAR